LIEAPGLTTPWITLALAAVHRANGLVDDLLDATRARLGGLLPIDRAPVDLARLAEQATEEHRARDTGHTIVLEAPAVQIASCDAKRISQVINNLIGNAVQHSTAGSTVRVTLRSHGDRSHEISVHNVGPPIPEGLRTRMFEPLERAGLTSTNHSIGLGLYIVHEIVQAHGGTITVDSTHDDGTTFRVLLPTD